MSLGRFTPLGWTQGLLAILAGLIASFFLFGFFSPYWRVADQDILLIFDAFLQNDGLPRQVDFHPVHLIVAMLSATYRALHSLGLLETYSLSTMPLASDVAAFTRSWTSAVQIARLLCLLIVLAYVTAFAFLLRALVKDWRVALLGHLQLRFRAGLRCRSDRSSPSRAACRLGDGNKCPICLVRGDSCRTLCTAGSFCIFRECSRSACSGAYRWPKA
jgi:hypothetical protein